MEPVRIMDFRGTYKGGGGPDKTILNSAAQHNPEKVAVLVTYIRQPDDNEFQITRAAKELGLNYVELIDHKILDWSCISQLKKLIHHERIVLLHSHDDKTLLYSVILKYLVPGLRIMHTCHSHAEYTRADFSGFSSYFKFKLRKKFLIFLMKIHNKPVLTISENTKSRLDRAGLSNKDIAVIHNGIDVDYWQKKNVRTVLREELNIGYTQFLVGTVARITYDKDLATFFKTAKLVSQKFNNAKFVIVGDGYGDELDQAKNEVNKLKLDKVVYFTGHRNDLRDIYSSFDIFLMTSRTEGLPNTALEAMALEIPVVSTRVGGVPELVVDGENGLLCPVGDATSLADAVCCLLENQQRRTMMAKKSRERIEQKFNFRNRVRLLEDIYLNLVSEGSRAVI